MAEICVRVDHKNHDFEFLKFGLFRGRSAGKRGLAQGGSRLRKIKNNQAQQARLKRRVS